MTAGKPQAGFCEEEAHNGAGSNTVTLSRPKGESNGNTKQTYPLEASSLLDLGSQ
jgi:hypothetical protein